jgi:hypothetical protein
MKYILIGLLGVISFTAIGQISKPIAPHSLSLNHAKLQEAVKMKDLELPALDNEAEIKKAKIAKDKACLTCPNNSFAQAVPFTIDLKQNSTKIELEDGYLWLLRLNSRSAKNLQFFFKDFYIPEGATLHIYNQRGDFILGAFTSDNINPDGRFSTSLFPDKIAILEYFEPKSAEFAGRLIIDKFSHGYKNIGTSDITERDGQAVESTISDKYGASGSCTINIACSQGDFVRNESKAVAFYTIIDRNGATKICTGFLVNSTDPIESKKPYFLTAGHCTDASDKPPGYYYSDAMFYFNYQSSDCENEFSNPLFRAKTFQGAYLISYGMDERQYNGSDYTLLELRDRPELWADVAYLGWDKRLISHTGNVYVIGHPSGDAKKISIGSDPVARAEIKFDGINYNNGIDYSKCWPNEQSPCWIFNNSGGGVTQAGSSGSAILNSSKRIIGVLTGGYSRCEDSPDEVAFCLNKTGFISGPDWGNRMDWLWNHPNTADKNIAVPYSFSPVSYYLDATLTGKEYIDSYFPPPPSTGGGGTGGGTTNTCRTVEYKGDPQGIKLTLADKNNQQFGAKVAASGDYFAVSAWSERSVYLYKRENCNVRLLGKISENAGRGVFGFSIDMDEDRMIVAESGSNHGGVIYFYERSGDIWTKVYQEEHTSRDYAYSVAIKGDHAVVGDPWANEMSFFKRVGGQWSFLQKTYAQWEDLRYGKWVDMESNRVVTLSSEMRSTQGVINLYKYSSTDDKWTLEQRFENSHYSGGPRFTTDGNTILIVNGGASTALKFQDNRWDESIAYPRGGFSAFGDYFIISTAHTNTLFKKDPDTGDYYASDSFEKENDRWGGDMYGTSVAVTKDYLVIGSPENHGLYSCDVSGAAFVYDLKDQFTYNKILCYHAFGIPRTVEAKNLSVAGSLCSSFDLASGSYHYTAVGKISLRPGFSVKSGAVFKASIVGCYNFNNGYLDDDITGGRLPADVQDNQIEPHELNQSVPAEANDVDEVKVFPNPVTTGNFEIQSQSPIVEVRLYTLQGQTIIVNAQHAAENAMDVQLPEDHRGLFLLKVVTIKKTIYKKLKVN